MKLVQYIGGVGKIAKASKSTIDWLPRARAGKHMFPNSTDNISSCGLRLFAVISD